MIESLLLARLKRETAQAQVIADADRLSLMKAAPTARDYVTFLERVYGFEVPVEIAFTMTESLDEIVDLRGRNEHRLLRCDLNALGVIDPASVLRCAAISPFRGIP